MERIPEESLHIPNDSEKSQYTRFRDENLLYLQPPTRRPATYNTDYRKPTVKIDSETTYGLSYMKLRSIPKPRIGYEQRGNRQPGNTGKFDSDTIYKLSYQASEGKLRKSFVPKSCLSITGCHDMATVHMTSYVNPGYAKVKPYKPYQEKIHNIIPMASETITKESYREFGIPLAVRKPVARQFWQTKSKTDYQTTSCLSYQHCIPVFKKVARIVHNRPPISAQIEKDTIYGTSYQVPGHFINKAAVLFK